jgi:hypothetical protein
MSRYALACAAVLFAFPGSVAGQKTLCFNGTRLPACANFLIVEMQGIVPVAETSRTIRWSGGESIDQSVFDDRLEWHLGLMRNLNERWAVGGAVGLGTGAAEALTSLTARGRRWLADDVALDVSAGVLYGPHEVGGGSRRGTLLDARLNYDDDVYGGVRWEQFNVRPWSDEFQTDPGGRQHAVSLLLGTGTEWAAAGTGALGVWTAIVFALLVANDS